MPFSRVWRAGYLGVSWCPISTLQHYSPGSGFLKAELSVWEPELLTSAFLGSVNSPAVLSMSASHGQDLGPGSYWPSQLYLHCLLPVQRWQMLWRTPQFLFASSGKYMWRACCNSAYLLIMTTTYFCFTELRCFPVSPFFNLWSWNLLVLKPRFVGFRKGPLLFSSFWCMPVIITLGMLRQEDHIEKGSLGLIASLL